MSSEEDIGRSLRDKINEIVSDYVADMDYDGMCSNDNCEIFGIIDEGGLVNAIMHVIEHG